ncbi:phage holin [Lactobacillus delbrueckii subsp. bulgaricus]|nr:phage holin [Lactobacillus delbrueckii subsp. bulgaricus]
MTVKDWIYLAMAMGGYLVAVIAWLYAKNKANINKATTAGKVMDVVGQLATYAVHEAERTDMSGDGKRKWAAEAVSQGLDWLGIKCVTPIAINGAIEDAVNAMHLANLQQAADQPTADQPADTKEVTNG